MARKESKSDMIDFGEFFNFKDGRSIFQCNICKKQFEGESLHFFMNHIEENHPVDNCKIKEKKIDSCKNQLKQKDESTLYQQRLPTKIKKDLKFPQSNNLNFKREPIPKLKIKRKHSQTENIEIINNNKICEAENSKQIEIDNIINFKIANTKSLLLKNNDNIEFIEGELLAKNSLEINDINYNICEGNTCECAYPNSLKDGNRIPEINVNTSLQQNSTNCFDLISLDKTENHNSERLKNIVNESDIESENHNNLKYQVLNVERIESKIVLQSNLKLIDKTDEKLVEESDNDMVNKCNLKDSNFEKKKDVKTNSYSCCRCGVEYKKEITLLKHFGKCKVVKSKRLITKKAKKNENGMYQCSNCDLELSLMDELKTHEKLHKLKKMKEKLQCEICGNYLSSEIALKRHLLKHTVGVPHKCLKRNSAFNNKDKLELHKQIHSYEKEYKCKDCDKDYYRYIDLKRHIRHNHSKNKQNTPVMCDVCGKSFSFAFNLKYHMRRHFKLKPIKCGKCDMTFVEKGDLNKHLITHNPDYKPFICETCSKSFSRKITLTKHQKLHTGLKEYICKICGKAFAQSPGLYMHMKTHGFNIKPEGAGHYERQSHLLFRNMNSDRANIA